MDKAKKQQHTNTHNESESRQKKGWNQLHKKKKRGWGDHTWELTKAIGEGHEFFSTL